MSTKCITCDKVCSYRTEDYVPEYASLQARHNALVEAVKKYFKSERLEILKRDARAEVDRLLTEEKP